MYTDLWNFTNAKISAQEAQIAIDEHMATMQEQEGVVLSLASA
jgi:hypothetical protein